MKPVSFACLLMGLLSAQDLSADWFDGSAPAAGTPSRISPTTGPTTGPVDSQIVIGGCHATVVKSLEQAIDSIGKEMDQLAASGDTANHDALADTLERYQTLLKKTQESAVPPSIYPLQLGKKGCLYVVRRIKAPAGTADKPRTVEIHVVSWMKVNILSVEQDQSIGAELMDAFGKHSLYRVVIEGLPRTLKAGSVVQLVNMQFECITEERTDQGKVYHLRKL